MKRKRRMRRQRTRNPMCCSPARSSRQRWGAGADAGVPRAGAPVGTSAWPTAAAPGWLRCCGYFPAFHTVGMDAPLAGQIAHELNE